MSRWRCNTIAVQHTSLHFTDTTHNQRIKQTRIFFCVYMHDTTLFFANCYFPFIGFLLSVPVICDLPLFSSSVVRTGLHSFLLCSFACYQQSMQVRDVRIPEEAFTSLHFTHKPRGIALVEFSDNRDAR